MNLKKAFTLQNNIDMLISGVRELFNTDMVLKKTIEHKKSEVNKFIEGMTSVVYEDEVEVLNEETYQKYDYSEIFAICQELIKAKAVLAEGINKAKNSASIEFEGKVYSYDAAITLAQTLRNVLCKVEYLKNYRDNTMKTTRNVNVPLNSVNGIVNTPVAYTYIVKDILDKNVVEKIKADHNKYARAIEELSDKIEAVKFVDIDDIYIPANIDNTTTIDDLLNIKK